MSLRPMLWAWDTAPVDDAVATLVLLALADEANDDGTDACPYKDKLIERSRKSERTVQDKLRELYRLRLIDFGDQRVAERRYGKRPGHAPRAWNLNLDATRANVPEPRTHEEMALYPLVMSGKIDFEVEAPSAQEGSGGVQKLPPSSDQGKRQPGGVQKLPPTQEGSGGVQKLPPSSDQGKRIHRREGGVQPTAPFPIGSKTKRKPGGFSGAHDDEVSVSSETAAEDPKILSPKIQNQEDEALALTEDIEFFPDLTVEEKDLFTRCLLAADDRWSPRILRKVIGTPLIRRLAQEDPELVRRVFLLAAEDPETTSPRRLLRVSKCPLWEIAGAQGKAEPQRPVVEREPQETPADLDAVEPAGQSVMPPAQRREEIAEYLRQGGLRSSRFATQADTTGQQAAS